MDPSQILHNNGGLLSCFTISTSLHEWLSLRKCQGVVQPLILELPTTFVGTNGPGFRDIKKRNYNSILPKEHFVH